MGNVKIKLRPDSNRRRIFWFAGEMQLPQGRPVIVYLKTGIDGVWPCRKNSTVWQKRIALISEVHTWGIIVIPFFQMDDTFEVLGGWPTFAARTDLGGPSFAFCKGWGILKCEPVGILTLLFSRRSCSHLLQ